MARTLLDWLENIVYLTVYTSGIIRTRERGLEEERLFVIIPTGLPPYLTLDAGGPNVAVILSCLFVCLR